MLFIWFSLSYIVNILVDIWIPSSMSVFENPSSIYSNSELASEIMLRNLQNGRQRSLIQFFISLVMICVSIFVLKQKNFVKGMTFFFVRVILVSSVVSLASSAGFLFADLFFF